MPRVLVWHRAQRVTDRDALSRRETEQSHKALAHIEPIAFGFPAPGAQIGEAVGKGNARRQLLLAAARRRYPRPLSPLAATRLRLGAWRRMGTTYSMDGHGGGA